jgi:hypothetical protein
MISDQVVIQFIGVYVFDSASRWKEAKCQLRLERLTMEREIPDQSVILVRIRAKPPPCPLCSKPVQILCAVSSGGAGLERGTTKQPRSSSSSINEKREKVCLVQCSLWQCSLCHGVVFGLL